MAYPVHRSLRLDSQGHQLVVDGIGLRMREAGSCPAESCRFLTRSKYF